MTLIFCFLVYAMLEARTKHYGKLLLLKGKLDMMTRQIVGPADDENCAQPSKEALLGKYHWIIANWRSGWLNVSMLFK